MNARPADSVLRMRSMTDADADAVMAVEGRAYPFPWTRGILLDCIRSGYACWVLEDADGQLLGYCVLSVAAGEGHLLNLCIAPEAQGRGLGRHLLERTIALGRWHRCERLFLEVRPSNASALALYHAAGFNEIGRRPGYYPGHKGREDALVFARELLGEDG